MASIAIKKPTRTISGVAPVAVMLPPRACRHGACLFCPSLNSPQSYTPKSPVVIRAAEVEFSPDLQVKNRLKQLEEMGHLTDKIELIIMGGTFLSYPVEFQHEFIKGCYDALNGKISVSLEEAKRANEKANHRCVALCIETRPDFCSDADISRMLGFGCTRVELGVQAVDDQIYKLNKRGHGVKEVIDATARLRRAGFKIGYHIMIGLYGSNEKKDINLFKKIFDDKRFRPDQIKIYPCQVIKGAELEKLYASGSYKPYTDEQSEKLIIKMLQMVPEYCRVMRIMREIPPAYLVAGMKNLGIRKEIDEKMRAEGMKIKEIRFRESGFALRSGKKLDEKIRIEKIAYEASGAKEIFMQAVNKEKILFGLLRLRLEKEAKMPAMIRELHVYGPVVGIGSREEEKYQHKGLGKKLMMVAEKLAKKAGKKEIKVISGVGVRDYYRSLGYMPDEKGYMAKRL